MSSNANMYDVTFRELIRMIDTFFGTFGSARDALTKLAHAFRNSRNTCRFA